MKALGARGGRKVGERRAKDEEENVFLSRLYLRSAQRQIEYGVHPMKGVRMPFFRFIAHISR